MPIITVKIAAANAATDLEIRSAALAARLSTEILRKKAELTAVVVELVDPKVWFAGGRSLAQQRASSFWLEIRVVEGTNTKDEKEAFIAAVFSGFAELLGDLHPESYVHVHEVKADAYGFGGLTQERRYIAGRLGTDPARRAA